MGAAGCSRTVLVALALLAAAAVLRGVAWASALPAWQGPDEVAHYAYVERLAGGEFPPLQPGETRDSSAVRASLAANAFRRFRFAAPDRPLDGAGPREPAGLPEDGYAAHGATIYPPGYYVLALPFYAVPGLDTATARLASARLLSALAAGGLVALTFLLVREATARAGLALAGAALVTLPPMMGQASGILNPDVLLAVAVAGLAWALLRARREPRPPRAWWHVAAWAALAGLTKPVGLPAAACVVVAFLLVPAALRSRRIAALAAAAVAGAALAVAVLVVAGGERFRSPAAFGARYVWNFYRPRLPTLTDHPVTTPAWSVWVESGVGGFGWLTVWLPPWAYGLALIAVAVAAAGAGAGLWRDRSGLPVAASCALAVLLYVALLHAAELESLLRDRGSLLQGRYLTAVAPLAVCGFLVSVASLPRAARLGLVGAVLAVWAFLAVLGLDATVSYFGS